MYQFPYFKDADPQAVLQFMEAHPFALLTCCDAVGKPYATQVPLLIQVRDGVVYLQGHVMRKTDHCRALEVNPQVLAVFTGPSAYVSATWYTDPSGGSTWNYMSVQVSGELRFMETDELKVFMQELSSRFETEPAAPTVFNNLPQTYVDAMMPAIAGFEIRAENMAHTFKLSQNRDAESYRNIIDQLESRGGQSAEIAREMKLRQERLFPQSGGTD